MNIVIGVNNLAKQLGVSRFTVYNYCDKGMPFIQKGEKKRIFDLEKVKEWLLNN